jgi:hypothetical protein
MIPEDILNVLAYMLLTHFGSILVVITIIFCTLVIRNTLRKLNITPNEVWAKQHAKTIGIDPNKTTEEPKKAEVEKEISKRKPKPQESTITQPIVENSEAKQEPPKEKEKNILQKLVEGNQ